MLSLLLIKQYVLSISRFDHVNDVEALVINV